MSQTEKTITVFMPFHGEAEVPAALRELSGHPLVRELYLSAPENHFAGEGKLKPLCAPSFTATTVLKQIARQPAGRFILLCFTDTLPLLGPYALERMVQVMEDSGAGMLYADHYLETDGERSELPLIDYQSGSLRDDFNLGSLVLYDTERFRQAVGGMDREYAYAGLYDLRLRISRLAPLVHLNEFLYAVKQGDTRKSGEKIFDYVDPKNRAVQLEMEAACTAHLKAVGGYLEPVFKPVELDALPFETEVSVIIPVRNREKTIRDAIASVLKQQADFTYNLIVIDNHSTDHTGSIIGEFSADPRVIHLVPGEQGLGIGGCWNMGIHHPRCGKFAVQLDSDDLYPEDNTLQLIRDTFYRQQCAMVVGSYRMVDFELRTIPPGVIDHKEWTPENGRNNALRINGLGAPRAFYTPVLRALNLPNTSYGEDYAVGLRICREYRIGRIYEVVYWCRRWSDNSDAELSIVQQNSYNWYKDRIRSWELAARIAKNRRERGC